MNPTDIYQKIEESYQNNRQRLIEFFQNHSYDEQQAEELSESMKVAVFFLETHAYDRHDLDIEMRKELKAPIKKEIEALKNAKPTMEQLVPQLDWDEIFEVILEPVEKHKFMQTRAGKNKSLEMALEPLFWRLETFDIGQTEQVNIVYDLFVEFGLDDYGKEYSTQDTLIGEKEQKERIRIHFQQKAMKERKQYRRAIRLVK
jgi:hypothetical protein